MSTQLRVTTDTLEAETPRLLQKARADGFDPDGIKVLPLSEFLAYEADDDPFEYVHVVPDDAEGTMRVYRSVEGYGDLRVMTEIGDVNFRSCGSDGPNPRTFYITSHHADSLLTALNSLKWERSPARATLTYYADAGRPMMEKYAVTEETLTFEYKTESGRRNAIQISSLYENELQSIAKY